MRVKNLDHYFDILEGLRVPRFRETMRVPVEYNKDASIDNLWKVHEEAMQRLGETGEGEHSLLDLKVDLAWRILESCCFCEHRCEVNRLKHQVGFCGVEAVSRYASEFLHTGEEPELVPSHTIFFTGCTFRCVYCQNWDIGTSPRSGAPILAERMAEVIALRHAQGARNVNFVGGDPGPHLHTILGIINIVRVDTPMIWNSNMYQSVEAMKLLDGVIDVYLADFRYGNDDCAKRLSKIKRYWEVTTRNFLEADRQTELLVRHLVLPGHLECCTRPIVEWIGEHMPDVRFNLMFQYRPQYKAEQYPDINRFLTREEQSLAIDIVQDAGLTNVLL